MRHLIVFLLFVLVSFKFSFSQNVPSVPGERPRLIVVVIVDQMRFDYLYRYQDKFIEGGFKRLINQGTICKNARHNYMLTQRIPGYVTVMAGAEPSNHGIVSDRWLSRINNKRVTAGMDNKHEAINAKGKDLNFGPGNLRTSFFTDQLKLATNKKSKVVSVAMDGDVAAMAGGFTADRAWWFDHASGNWITSTYYADSLDLWVQEFNAKKFSDLYLDRQWLPLQNTYAKPEEEEEEFSVKGFLHDLVNIKKLTNNYRELKRTPFGNTLTKDFAISAIVNDSLGYDENTDVLIVGFNATGHINEKYGPLSDEIEDTYLRLDQDFKHFLEFLDSEIGKEQTLVVFTADRGTGFSPEFLTEYSIPSGEFDHRKAIAVLGSYLDVIYGKGEWIKDYSAKQIYLDHQLIDDAKVDLVEMQDRIARFLVQFSGVSDAVPAYILQRSNFTRGSNLLMQNSYHRQRSGDVLIQLEPGWIEKTDKMISQNSGYDYDTHVPLIWYGWKMPRLTIFRDIHTSDIAVTISELLEIAPPNGNNGKIIRELIER